MSPKNIQITDYTYTLPEERIAKYPLKERDQSKLLVYRAGEISSSVFKNSNKELPKDSLLIFNTTKVIRARLLFRKPTGATIEIFCLEPYTPSDYAMALQTTNTCRWKCLVGNLKRWKESEITLQIETEGKVCKLSAQIIEKLEDAFIIEFDWDTALTFSEILEYSGAIPIPPYLNRKSEAIDYQRYQTQQGIKSAELTLHVGAGTFKPVKAETVGEHHMHTEVFSFSETLLDALLENKKIIAVGTTAVRSLERKQWEAYELPKFSKEQAIKAVKSYMQQEGLKQVTAKTDILIAPSYTFHIISGMFTNFHQPQSTLLLLVAALVGDDWKKIYNYALANDYRFLSYGDSSLLLAPRNI